MARKKKQTYNEMIRTMDSLQKKAIAEKDRIAELLVSVLDHDTALRLGDLSDSELRRVASLVFTHIGMFVNLARVNTPESKRSQDADDAPMAEGEVRCNHAENSCEVWDTETNQLIGKLHDGMCVELRDFDSEDWVPVKIRMVVSDMWFMVGNDSPRAIFDGLQVRIHKAKV